MIFVFFLINKTKIFNGSCEYSSYTGCSMKIHKVLEEYSNQYTASKWQTLPYTLDVNNILCCVMKYVAKKQKTQKKGDDHKKLPSYCY